MCKMQSTVSLNSFTVFALLYTYLFPVTLELRENLLQISLPVQFPGSEATFSECGSQNVFHHGSLPDTSLCEYILPTPLFQSLYIIIPLFYIHSTLLSIVYIAFLYNFINPSTSTSLGLPGLQGSSIALSASISKSSSFAP